MTPGARFECRQEKRKKERYSTSKENFSIILVFLFFFQLRYLKIGYFPRCTYLFPKEMGMKKKMKMITDKTEVKMTPLKI